jgi:hypothetical protein
MKVGEISAFAAWRSGPSSRRRAAERDDAWTLQRGLEPRAWRAGQVVYVTTNGGHTAPPPDGVVRKVLRMELRPA